MNARKGPGAAGLMLLWAVALTSALSAEAVPAAAGRTIAGHSYNINGHLASVLVFGTTLTFGF